MPSAPVKRQRTTMPHREDSTPSQSKPSPVSPRNGNTVRIAASDVRVHASKVRSLARSRVSRCMRSTFSTALSNEVTAARSCLVADVIVICTDEWLRRLGGSSP
uniref:Uncharacterized protein n=1 Tax=Alexandrium monilatum TaxID=311494 RepID=A0A7S4R039_9DINO|mmetsp:Transcript_12809/g.38580  ORF Transcript_12809/g.38580 Transcript_12809/m.38580 type:complete len:104 (+) Transcript_12809:372-683(+)